MNYDLVTNSYLLPLNIDHDHTDQESDSERDEQITSSITETQYKWLILKDMLKNPNLNFFSN